MTFDIGANLTAVLIALIAGFPAVIAAYYSRKANQKVEAVEVKVDGTATLLNERLQVAEAGQHSAEGFRAGEEAQRSRENGN